MKRIFLVSLLLISSFIYGKEQYSFSNITSENGLSSATITCIYEDPKGFMWFGTRNGLNRFDGYKIDVFCNTPGDSTTISDNHILCLAEDNDGYLWAGTKNGLNRFDRKTNELKRYFFNPLDKVSLSNNTITSIHFDKKNDLWVGTSNGLNLYNRREDSFMRINPGGLLYNNAVKAIRRKGDYLYLGTLSNGLIVYNTTNRKYKVYKSNIDNSRGFVIENINSILVDKNETVWIATNNGICTLNKEKKDFWVYNTKYGLTNNNVTCLAETSNGEIVAGTQNGLNKINPRTDEVKQITGLNHQAVYSICLDKAQTLWVGTYAGGVNYHNTLKDKFQFFDPTFAQKTVFGSIENVIDTKGSLFMATETGGLLEMDKSTGLFKQYKIFDNAEDTDPSNTIKSLFLDDQKILCGTNVGSIYNFDLKTKKFSLRHDLPSADAIHYIGKSSSGDLIVAGGSHTGLIFISKDKEMKRDFPLKGLRTFSFPDTRCILEVNPNIFLVGTRNEGLFYYNAYRKELIHFFNDGEVKNTIPNNHITSIIKDRSGKIWIGTFGGGLSLFNLKAKTFSTYNANSGLIDNRICSIIEGNNQHLWISTPYGISDFDVDSHIFYNYNKENGIRINEFTANAGIRTLEGNIVFCGDNGFISFDPSKVSYNSHVPPIVLKDIYVNNNRITTGIKRGAFESYLGEIKDIELEENENNITIEYTALDFISPDKNRYMYMLEGFDQTWNDADKRRVAQYTNLPIGKYKFIVKGSNNDGIWNTEGITLNIVIKKPSFWISGWAYLLYIMFALTVLSSVLKYLIKKFNTDKEIDNIQIEREAEKECELSSDAR